MTELDIRLAYHSDTGHYPVEGCSDSLRELSFQSPFEENELPEEIPEFITMEKLEMIELTDLSIKDILKLINSKINTINQLNFELTKRKEVEASHIVNVQAEANAWCSDLLNYVDWLERKLIQ